MRLCLLTCLASLIACQPHPLQERSLLAGGEEELVGEPVGEVPRASVAGSGGAAQTIASVAVSVGTPDLLDQDFMQRIRSLVDLSASAHAGSRVSCSHELTVDFAAGEDLQTAAQALQLSPQALIERLCAARYQVAMLDASGNEGPLSTPATVQMP